jgi:hypothetical protein
MLGPVLRRPRELSNNEVSWFWEQGMRIFLKKLFFQGNLCYHASDKTMRLENKMVPEVPWVGKEVSNIILQRKQLRLRHNLC